MICPLMSKICSNDGATYTNPDKLVEIECFKDRCAMWIKFLGAKEDTDGLCGLIAYED